MAEATAAPVTIGRAADSLMEDNTPPAWLSPPKLRNSEVPPEDWAMTVEQFLKFVGACRGTRCWKDTKCNEGHVNLYTITDALVKQWTRRTGAGIALRLNPDKPLRAELMISHSWGEDMDECCEALEDFCKRKSLKSSTAIWFCAFAQYQPGDEPGDPGPTVAQQLQLDPFGSVIKSVSCAHGMVVVHTSIASVYSRLWCVYEISEALQSGTPVQIAYSKVYMKLTEGSLSEMLHAHTEEAHCANDFDEERIRENVCKGTGFGDLDHKIFHFRLQAVQEMSQELGSDWQQRMEEELHSVEEELKLEEKQLAQPFRRSVLCLSLALAVGLAITVIVNLSFRADGTSNPGEVPPGPPWIDTNNASDNTDLAGNASDINSSDTNTTTTPFWFHTYPEEPQPVYELWALLAIPALTGFALLCCCWRCRVAWKRRQKANEELRWRLAAARAVREGGEPSRRLAAP